MISQSWTKFKGKTPEPYPGGKGRQPEAIYSASGFSLFLMSHTHPHHHLNQDRGRAE